MLVHTIRKTQVAVVGAVTASLAFGACLAISDAASARAASHAKIGTGKTITVWSMQGDLSAATLKAINSKFTAQTGAKVNVQTQQWTNIATKVTTALATSAPPDVLDLGNTQVGDFAAAGGLANLTKYKSQLAQGQTWLGGLVSPATLDGKLYGVPSLAGARAVIYNKQMWAAAGVKSAPKTYKQLQADLNKVKAANSSNANFSAFYMPGQYWYGAMQWVWDAGGNIATEKNGTWSAGFSSPGAQRGLAAWKTFQNTYSSVASRTLNTDKPSEDTVFADGDTSAILGLSWEAATIIQDNKKLNGKLGSFPMPGISGHTQPVMLGGSDWGIASKSPNQALAVDWAKIAASPAIQKQYVYGTDRLIPNSVQTSKAAVASKSMTTLDKAFFTAADSSKATPSAGGWAQLEDPDMTNFFQAIASGTKTPAAAASAFDSIINQTLNKQA